MANIVVHSPEINHSGSKRHNTAKHKREGERQREKEQLFHNHAACRENAASNSGSTTEIMNE